MSATLPEEPVVLTPSAAYRPPTDEELDLLRQIGERWAQTLGGRRPSRARLPADPDLVGRGRPLPPMSRYERLVRIVDEGFVPARPGTVVATEGAIRPPSRLGRVVFAARRVLLGPPLATTAIVQERLSKLVALAVLSSDALSSVAYGTEAMLVVLVLAGTAALPASLPIGAAIVLLMLVVGASYRQTIRAYPRGGGSYIVASDNLGRRAGLVAAAGLMTDYVLTVAVSVAAGVAAVTSALPALEPYTVGLGVGLIALILAANLRGIRQSGTLFAVPTYAFVAGILVLIAVGLGRAAMDGWRFTPPPQLPGTEALGPLLLLRAFASGCSAMTGIEAIADGVPAFRPPEWRNARTTLTWMIGLLVVMFAGITLLTPRRAGALVPRDHPVAARRAHLSQSGMTVRWWRRREAGWARSLPINALGATLSGTVLLIIAVSKFTEGAWVIVLVIPLIIIVLSWIRRHYAVVEQATALHPPSGETGHLPLLRARREVSHGARPAPEQVEAPDEITHLVVVPVAWLDLPALRALAYAVSLCLPVLALHVATDDEDARRLRTLWSAWGDHVPLEVIMSPYRVVVEPAANYVRTMHRNHPDLTITTVLPELVVTRWWHQLLHNQVALRLRRLLRLYPGTVVTSVPFHLPEAQKS